MKRLLMLFFLNHSLASLVTEILMQLQEKCAEQNQLCVNLMMLFDTMNRGSLLWRLGYPDQFLLAPILNDDN